MWRTLFCIGLLESTVFLTAFGSGIPLVSFLNRKGKRWPETSTFSNFGMYRNKGTASLQRQNLNPSYQASHIDLFGITGISRKNSGPYGQVTRKKAEAFSHNRRRSSRSHSFHGSKPLSTLLLDHSYDGEPPPKTSFLNSIANELEEQVYDKDFSPGSEQINLNSASKDHPVETDSQQPQFARGCYDTRNNCSERYPFPSSAVMIEAHYNQTVRDFLQICTPIEQVEISGIGDIQDLLNTLYQQIIDQEQFKTPFTVILIFNLESYVSWAKDRVFDVLQAAISILQNDFDDTTIYSKFHQDGSDGNDTNLLLAYDVKYWLSNICDQRLTACADFASIILESVLQINDLDAVGESEKHSSEAHNYQDTSAKANAWCQKLGMGPGSRIIDIRAQPFRQKDYVREESSLVLADILPKDSKTYDKNRAPKYFGQPTVVYFHVTVLSIDTINEESMTYVADIFLAQSWRDHRLRLPENMTEEYRILDVRWLNDIWRPDCFFKNAKKVTFHEMSVPNHYLWLYHDKTLIYMAKLTLVLSCAMKFESYPHDTQVCSMQIESLSHTTHDLVFRWNVTDPLVTNPDIELPQLDIAKNTTEDCTLEYSTGNFTCLAIVFNLRRRLGYHLFHTYIPSALIVVMSWISFWIKPEAIPARATLGVTSLLTLATQSTQSQRSLPPVSYVKAIDVWMSSCTVFVFMSLMEFAVVNSFMGPVATKPMKGYSDEDLTSSIRQPSVYNGNSATRVRGKGSSPIWPGPPPPPSGPQYVTFCNGREVALFIDKWSRLFFPFSFMILNVVYWTTFLH